MDELKKCPFCGWPASLITETPKFYGRQVAYVRCENPKCQAAGSRCSIRDNTIAATTFSAPISPRSLQKGVEEAIEKWNRRSAA